MLIKQTSTMNVCFINLLNLIYKKTLLCSKKLLLLVAEVL